MPKLYAGSGGVSRVTVAGILTLIVVGPQPLRAVTVHWGSPRLLFSVRPTMLPGPLILYQDKEPDMALNDLIKLENELLSAEGKVTSVILDDAGGTITGKINVSIYGLVYVNYNLSKNPETPGQGGMVGNASAIDDDGASNTAALHGVWKRTGHQMKIYCMDDISDGMIHLAVVSIDFRADSLKVDFSRIAS